MKHVFDLSKWLLEHDIRAKNAVSFLAALLSVVVFYFASRHCRWFQEIQGYAAIGVGVVLLMVFLIGFLSTWLVYSGVATHWQRLASRERAQEEAGQEKESLRNNLESLSDWQGKFLLRFIVEGRRQIPEFEVGRYKAAWDFEMGVLIEKGIVKEHRQARVYEIEPHYHDYLKENWNPETGALG